MMRRFRSFLPSHFVLFEQRCHTPCHNPQLSTHPEPYFCFVLPEIAHTIRYNPGGVKVATSGNSLSEKPLSERPIPLGTFHAREQQDADNDLIRCGHLRCVGVELHHGV